MVFSFVNKRFVHVIKLLQIIITGLWGIVNNFFVQIRIEMGDQEEVSCGLFVQFIV